MFLCLLEIFVFVGSHTFTLAQKSKYVINHGLGSFFSKKFDLLLRNIKQLILSGI